MPAYTSRPKFPSLNALKAFEAAARHQSFTKAAQELHVTAGAIAQQIKLLEDWLGCPLFQRSAQGIKLTPEAQQALPPLSAAFDQLSAAVSHLRQVNTPTEISIAALPSVALLWLSPRLPALSSAFPEHYFSVTAMEQPPNFRREPYDLAVFYVRDAPEGMVRIGLGRDELFPVCAPRLLAQAQSNGQHWSSLRLLHDTIWRNYWQLWLDEARVPGVQPATGAEFSLYSMARQAAIDGAGVLMGRSSLIDDALRHGLLVPVSELRVPAPDELSILLPDSAPSSAQFRPLVSRLQALAGQPATQA